MKIFIETADLNEINEANSFGILDGVDTTTISVKQAKVKLNFEDLKKYIKDILKILGTKPLTLIRWWSILHSLCRRLS